MMKKLGIALLVVLATSACSTQSEWDTPLEGNNQGNGFGIEEPTSTPAPSAPSEQTTPSPSPSPSPSAPATPSPSPSPSKAAPESPTPSPAPSPTPSAPATPTAPATPSPSPTPNSPELVGFASPTELFDFFYNRQLDLRGKTLTYEEISQDVIENGKDVTQAWGEVSTNKKSALIKKYLTNSPFKDYAHYGDLDNPNKVKASILFWYGMSYLWESVPLEADFSSAIVNVDAENAYVDNTKIVFLSSSGEQIADTIDPNSLPAIHATKIAGQWHLNLELTQGD